MISVLSLTFTRSRHEVKQSGTGIHCKEKTMVCGATATNSCHARPAETVLPRILQSNVGQEKLDCALAATRSQLQHADREEQQSQVKSAPTSAGNPNVTTGPQKKSILQKMHHEYFTKNCNLQAHTMFIFATLQVCQTFRYRAGGRLANTRGASRGKEAAEGVEDLIPGCGGDKDLQTTGLQQRMRRRCE